MAEELIKVPDIGGAEGAEIVEVLVAPGDSIDLEQSLVVVESDKASMEIPAPMAGTVAELGNCPRHRCGNCLLYTSPSPRDATLSRMPSSA